METREGNEQEEAEAAEVGTSAEVERQWRHSNPLLSLRAPVKVGRSAEAERQWRQGKGMNRRKQRQRRSGEVQKLKGNGDIPILCFLCVLL
jgi:hypothetical protein